MIQVLQMEQTDMCLTNKKNLLCIISLHIFDYI